MLKSPSSKTRSKLLDLMIIILFVLILITTNIIPLGSSLSIYDLDEGIDCDTLCAPVNDSTPPVSSVNPIELYWMDNEILALTATDDHAGVVAMELWYCYEGNDPILFVVDDQEPWEWNYTWPAGQGEYGFFTIAIDCRGNREAAPETPDVEAGYDFLEPVSWVNELPYDMESFVFDIDITAYDQGPSGIRNVQFWYRYSDDGISWSEWLMAWDDFEPSNGWGGVFQAPYDEVMYEFSSKAEDMAGNLESIEEIRDTSYQVSQSIWYSNEHPANGTSSDNGAQTISIDLTGIDPESIHMYVNGHYVDHQLTIITGGWRVSSWNDHGFANDVVHCRVTARNSNGERLEHNWSFSVSYSITIPLNTGWNLISIPLILPDNNITEVLSSINGSWTKVFYYDASDVYSHWRLYSTTRPDIYNDLRYLDHEMGFWIYCTRMDNLSISGCAPQHTVIELRSGWNMVGYPSMNEMTVAEALAGIQDPMLEVCDTHYPYDLRDLAADDMMEPGKGYWVYVDSHVIWIIDG
ncbi:MAG: hypothetical protein KAS16_07885 [Thermoplasmata archaeon]|nr:hypothetical protein [Thermoplasmata archaeon]